MDNIEHYEKMNYCPNCKKNMALEIIKNKKLLNYVFKNWRCARMYHLTLEEITILKEVLK